MKQRNRLYYTQTQKALMWERWKAGESLQYLSKGTDLSFYTQTQLNAIAGRLNERPKKTSDGFKLR
jgi:IS30 family transposase